MRATVALINHQRGMLGAVLENGDYSLIEILDTVFPELGDVLECADFSSLGGETIRNMTQGLDVDVFLQDICSRQYLVDRGFRE